MNRASFGLLYILHHAGELNGRELATQLGVSTSAVTQSVEKMEQDELVQRQHSIQDRRVAWFSLSPNGKQLIKQIGLERNALWKEILADMSEKELELLLKLQKQMLVKLENFSDSKK